MNRKLFKATDLFVILFIVFIATFISFFLYSGANSDFAEIYVDSKLVKTVSLNDNTEFSLSELDGFVFKVESGGICVYSSACENKICVNTGYISKGNQTIICLPYKLCIRTVSSDNSFDAVAG